MGSTSTSYCNVMSFERNALILPNLDVGKNILHLLITVFILIYSYNKCLIELDNFTHIVFTPTDLKKRRSHNYYNK
ncbi:hypothetical protein BH11BAC3_BH11BAC3_40170 [soil metagenome]